MDYLTQHYKNLSEQLQQKVNHLHHLIRLSEENFAKPENGENLDDYKGMDKQHAEQLRYKQKQRKENLERSKNKVSARETQHETEHKTQDDSEKEIPKNKGKDNKKYEEESNKYEPSKPEPRESEKYDKGVIKPNPNSKYEDAKRPQISKNKPVYKDPDKYY